jgi:hypothetical protein
LHPNFFDELRLVQLSREGLLQSGQGIETGNLALPLAPHAVDKALLKDFGTAKDNGSPQLCQTEQYFTKCGLCSAYQENPTTNKRLQRTVDPLKCYDFFKDPQSPPI